MGKTFKKNKFNDKPSSTIKKDKSLKYKYHLHIETEDDSFDEETRELESIDSEADSCLFNTDGSPKSEVQLIEEGKKLEEKIKELENPT